jgi:hypothetical protein
MATTVSQLASSQHKVAAGEAYHRVNALNLAIKIKYVVHVFFSLFLLVLVRTTHLRLLTQRTLAFLTLLVLVLKRAQDGPLLSS